MYRGRTTFRGRSIEVVVEGDAAAIPDASALFLTVGERFDEYLDYLVEHALDLANDWRDEHEILTPEEFRSRLWFEAIVFGEPGVRITCGYVDERDDNALVLLLDSNGGVVELSGM